MKRNNIFILIVMFSFLCVSVMGCGGKAEKPSKPQSTHGLADAVQEPITLDQLSKGKNGKIIIRKTGPSSESGERVTAGNNYKGVSVLAFGKTAQDVAAGRNFSFGGKNGFSMSVSESLWSVVTRKLKTWLFYAAGIIGVAFVALGLTGGWGTAAATLGRLFASAVPFIGSITEKIFGNKKASVLETGLNQVVKGVQAYKAKAPENKEALNNELEKAQDTPTKQLVKDAKAI